jgi:methionyl-tRNA formyltransferase
MKIIFLVKSSVLMHYYVNTVHERFPVARIIQEQPRRTPVAVGVLDRLMQKGPRGIARATFRRAKALVRRTEGPSVLEQHRAREVEQILGAKAHGFPTGVPIAVVEDINSPAVRDLLQAERPDVILVQGTSIVRDATLPHGVFNFNMHGGLSPYYRGGASVRWALVNWDPYNIGVTLHRLTEQSDAGSIIAQRRVIPGESDTSYSIALRLTKEGSALALRVLDKFSKGETIEHHEQDLSVGQCYFGKHWQPELTALIERIDQQGLISQMLNRPSTRVKRPIVEWSAD